MSQHWQGFIKDGVQSADTPYALEQWRFLFPVFEAIQRCCPHGGRILDVGCGAGIFTALLAHHGYEVTDERLYRRGQVAELVTRAGLRVRESFIYGEVPTAVATNLERFLPGALYRQVKNRCSYGMGICSVGERHANTRGAN